MDYLVILLFIFYLLLVIFVVCLTLDCLFEKPVNIKGAHVLVTGGSSGIGKEVAREALRLGANVTILARNTEKLNSAINDLKGTSTNVAMLSLDVSDNEKSSEEIRRNLQGNVDSFGPVKVLVNCAGFSVPGRAYQMSDYDVKKMMDVNYLGSVKMTQALLPEMITHREGAIIFTSSVGGLIGIYGLAAYCGSKFAVRGYAEALAMELSPFGIKVSVNCPPDTNTPGFATEQATKPEETALICEGAGLFNPEKVARNLLHEGLKGTFLSTNGLDGWLVTNISIGMAYSSFRSLFVQVGLLGFMRIIAFGYQKYFHYIIYKCYKKRELTKKTH